MILKAKHFAGHLRLLALLLIVTLVASACVLPSSSDTNEPITFNGPPIVRIETPLTGDTYQEGVGINIQARVENAGPDITRISIQVDGIIVGEQTSPNTSGAASFTVNTGWPASGVGQHTISVSASRGNGAVSNPTNVIINVVAAPNADEPQVAPTDTVPQQAAPSDIASQVPTQDNSAQQVAATNTFVPPPTNVPTNPPAATNTPAPPPATATVSRPQIRVSTGANVRSGPGLVFEPPVGSLAANAVANILAVNPAGTWYKIQYYNGEAWISTQVVEVTGDITTLPRDAGPATPIAATNTPVPTATPDTQIDLVITLVNISPHPFVCAQSSEIQITIVNIGTSTSAATEVVVRDLYNGQESVSSNAPVPALGPNQQHVAVIYLTVSTNIAEGHTTRVVIDPNNAVPELDESNNTSDTPYVLDAGSC
jgi:CARDB protein/SH3 domain-containing protein